MNDIDDLDALEFDTSEGEEPSEWEKRFENQINTFFDEAIERVPGFVDRHLTSFKRIMGRSVSPKTGLGDIVVGVRNLVSNVSSSLGGPDFSRETYTDEELTRAFEREVVSPEELEGLIRRLFREFERDQWDKIESSNDSEQLRNLLHHRLTQFGDLDEEDLKDYNPGTTREHMETVMEREIAHDPLLAQVIRSGVKIGLPATLGYVLFGKVSYAGNFGSQAASQLYRRRLDLYNRALLRLGQYQVPGWVGAVGWAGGLVGTLAIGGLMEFAVNSIRDVKGSYIRQLNAARYVLLYGENPETPEGQGIIHLVRGLERQFDQLPELSDDILDELEDLDRIAANADGDELQPGSDGSKEADASNPPPLPRQIPPCIPDRLPPMAGSMRATRRPPTPGVRTRPRRLPTPPPPRSIRRRNTTRTGPPNSKTTTLSKRVARRRAPRQTEGRPSSKGKTRPPTHPTLPPVTKRTRRRPTPPTYRAKRTRRHPNMHMTEKPSVMSSTIMERRPRTPEDRRERAVMMTRGHEVAN